MRVSTEEVRPGLGRWVARLHNRYGAVMFAAFGNNADAAEDNLLLQLCDFRSGVKIARQALARCLPACDADRCEYMANRVCDGLTSAGKPCLALSDLNAIRRDLAVIDDAPLPGDLCRSAGAGGNCGG